MPLRELDGHTPRPDEKDEFPGMEIHDVVTCGISILLHRIHDRLQIIDRETDVVETKLVQIANVGINDRRRIPIMQKLDFGSR